MFRTRSLWEDAIDGRGPVTDELQACCPGHLYVISPARRIASTPSSALSSTVVLIAFKCPRVMADMRMAAAVLWPVGFEGKEPIVLAEAVVEGDQPAAQRVRQPSDGFAAVLRVLDEAG